MRKLFRHHIALVLILINALSMALPLAPLVHADGHGQGGAACAGDCAVCGCAPVKSASRTCCCWQRAERERLAAETPDCCEKNQVQGAVPTCSNLPCGGKDTLFADAQGEPSLPPAHIDRPRVYFLEGALPSSAPDRPSDPIPEPPDHPPEAA